MDRPKGEGQCRLLLGFEGSEGADRREVVRAQELSQVYEDLSRIRPDPQAPRAGQYDRSWPARLLYPALATNAVVMHAEFSPHNRLLAATASTRVEPGRPKRVGHPRRIGRFSAHSRLGHPYARSRNRHVKPGQDIVCTSGHFDVAAAQPWFWPGILHAGQANLVFCDGHVKAGRQINWVATNSVARCRWNSDHEPHPETWARP